MLIHRFIHTIGMILAGWWIQNKKKMYTFRIFDTTKARKSDEIRLRDCALERANFCKLYNHGKQQIPKTNRPEMELVTDTQLEVGFMKVSGHFETIVFACSTCSLAFHGPNKTCWNLLGNIRYPYFFSEGQPSYFLFHLYCWLFISLFCLSIHPVIYQITLHALSIWN